jgi:acyl-CoA reductase-like NAD-dependent aldehyde dehydrogenase
MIGPLTPLAPKTTTSPGLSLECPSRTPGDLLAIDPSTGVVFRRFAATPPSQIPALVLLSCEAQVAWAALSCHGRAVAIQRLREVVARQRGEAAEAIPNGIGKPLRETWDHDIGLTPDILDDYIDHAGEYLADEPIAIPTRFGLTMHPWCGSVPGALSS